MPTLREAMTTEAIDADYRKRLVVDSKRAAALGMSVHAYRGQRSTAITKWTHTIRTLMDENRADDPVEILPAIIASAEEHVIRDAKAAAEVAARAEIQRLLRKAAIP
jgi:hypothetical protein